MQTVCCVCQKIRRRGTWVAMPLGHCSLPLSHGYCPGCFKRLMARLSQAGTRHRHRL